MFSQKSFDKGSAPMITLRHAHHNPELSPAVPGHQTKNGIFVLDIVRASQIFDWRHIVVRNLLRDNNVRHIGIDRRPWGDSTRIVGVPLTKDDKPKDMFMERGKKVIHLPDFRLDIRTAVNAKDVVPTSVHGEVSIIPDFEARVKHCGDLAIRFAYPEDIEEQIAALYVSPYWQQNIS